MDGGIRVELHVESPEECPVSTLASESDESVSMISWNSANGGDTITEEFTGSRELTAIAERKGNGNGHCDDNGSNAGNGNGHLETIFEGDVQSRYRFVRSNNGCLCSVIEKKGFPIETVRPEDGGLCVSFFASDLDSLNEIVTTLRDSFAGVQLRRLQQTQRLEESDPVWMDLSELTGRQQEVIRTAFEMGYFDYPKRANASEVAEELGIAASTFSEHISTAQRKILDGVFSE